MNGAILNIVLFLIILWCTNLNTSFFFEFFSFQISVQNFLVLETRVSKLLILQNNIANF
jgi:hypothetical protein